MPLKWNEAANKWEGDDTDPLAAIEYDRYSDLPDPTTMAVGALVLVKHDSQDVLNGLHLALGGPVGGNATYWIKC